MFLCIENGNNRHPWLGRKGGPLQFYTRKYASKYKKLKKANDIETQAQVEFMSSQIHVYIYSSLRWIAI